MLALTHEQKHFDISYLAAEKFIRISATAIDQENAGQRYSRHTRASSKWMNDMQHRI